MTAAWGFSGSIPQESPYVRVLSPEGQANTVNTVHLLSIGDLALLVELRRLRQIRGVLAKVQELEDISASFRRFEQLEASRIDVDGEHLANRHSNVGDGLGERSALVA